MDQGGGGAIACLVLPVPSTWPWEAASALGLTLSLCSRPGEQTKALVTQLTLFNQVLTELREDIRDQVRQGGPWAGCPRSTLPGGAAAPDPVLCCRR